ncbi:hypothetical protein [Rhizobium rhizogenes]|uniref:hypothetical protein n=1 Tax=Rhizobium rhizogenes TaxID=359 RepID=UPI0024BE89B7|nr:hypothetical protein [Rhizobium rhizogenes]
MTHGLRSSGVASKLRLETHHEIPIVHNGGEVALDAAITDDNCKPADHLNSSNLSTTASWRRE